MMDQHYPKRRGASLAVIVLILVIGWSSMRPADYNDLMLKWVSAALASLHIEVHPRKVFS
jgi:hypothetical protein